MDSSPRPPRPLALACLPVLFLLLLPAVAAFAQYVPPANNRVDLNFNADWRFIKSDVANAQTPSFNDAAWTAVSLPHTWNDDKFREWIATEAGGPGSADPLRPNGTYYGIGWYRKHFTIDPAYAGRKVILEFQGIGRAANFFVNGTALGYHENGVGPCGLDITSALNPAGTDNVIAIQVNNNENYVTLQYGVKLPYGQPFNPNFGGLNRDVTLHVLNPLYQTLPLYRNLGTQGTYVYPSNIDTLHKTADLTITAEVQNDSGAPQTATLEAALVDASGNQVGSTLTAAAQTIAAGARTTFTTNTSLSAVHFWAPDYPYMYQVYTVLKVNGTAVDVYKTPLGVRKVIFNATYGLQINGHPLYLNGYAPRCSMEWPDVGVPTDWMNEYDFALMKQTHANFVRPMHIAPRKVQVEAADKYGIIMTVPAANNEGDETDPNIWQERLDIMRDVTIYFRNDPSVLFYEGCNQILTAQHMQDMLNVRIAWDPNGGRLAGLRSNDADVTQGIREYGCTMDGAGHNLTTPLWDAEYARGEAPRRVWDNYTPMLNPRWDGVNADPTPAAGTVGDKAHKYLLGGYFYIASNYHQNLGLNSGNSDFIGDYLTVIPSGNNPTHAYFRLQNSEDMVLENLAKYYARYANSVFIQPAATNTSQGVMVGGAKIIWSDSVTDGRMHDTEVTRVSGAVDGARLPKEVFYGLQVAHNSQPQVYVVGHWNYPAGTTKTVYVASNTAQVKLQTFDTNGTLLHDYGFGTTNFFPSSILPAGGDQINNYVFAFPNVAWTPGSVVASGYNSGSATAVATSKKSTVGAPAALRVTPLTGPTAWYADGSDIAMFDVEVVDASGNRCPTYEDAVTFSCSGAGTFLGGYNSGIRYSTNFSNLTNGYKLNVEAGINRVFARATRTAGAFTLNVSAPGLTSASATVTSAAWSVTNGLTAIMPQRFTVPLGAEPPAVAEGVAPPPPANSPNPAPAANVSDLHYSGSHADAAVLVENVQPGQLAYLDSQTITLPANLPNYLIGGEFIQPFQDDAGETSSTDQYQFDLTRYSFVYQLIDAANGMPTHNNNDQYAWTKLSGTVTVNGRAMNIYKSKLLAPYSNVYLAANGHQNAAPGFDPASNMYLLFIVSAEQELQKPGDNISASTTQGTYVAANAIDGNTATRWNAVSGGFPQQIDLDLGANVLVGGYDINWYLNANRYYKYQVLLSPDGTNYSMSLDMSGNANTGEAEYRVPAIYTTAGRYVRIIVNSSSGGGWAAINDLKVRGVLANSTATSVPTITSALTDSGKAGYAYSYQITASGAPTGFAAQGLPVGFTINGVTGVISGTTTQSGTIPITVSAVNGAGTGSAVLNLTLAAPPPVPVVNSALNVSTKAGVVMTNYSVTATNTGYTPVSYSATIPSGLVGLAFNATTGVLSGTPKYPGTFTIPLSVTNVGGTGPVANLTLTVTPNGNPPTVTGGSAAATLGTAFSYQIAATGSPTLYGATNLPAGLTLATATGIISGTSQAAGTFNTIVLSASNAGGTGTANLTITVTQNPNAPSITSALTASGNVNLAFSYTITATNTPTGYNATPLPAGLALNGNIISGKPTAQGTTNVTLTATNGSGSDVKTLVVTVGAALTPPVVNSPANAVGAVNAYFSYQITATNSPATFTAAPLPAGLSVNPSTGLISGTPTAAGTTSVNLGASNASGAGTGKTLSIVISAAGSDVNLALNQPAFASTLNGTNAAALAVDGDGTVSRWESVQGTTADPSWWYVDLGAARPLHSVVILWQNAGGKDYLIQTTNNDPTIAANWTAAAAEITDGTAGQTRTITLNGGVNARYVRMYGKLRTGIYGYSMYEFQAMGTLPVMPAPTGVTTTVTGASAGQVVLNWTAVAGATSYTIQRSTNAAFGYTTIGSVNAPTASYTDSDPALRAGTTYYYQVIAVNAQGTSMPNNPVTGTPYVPAGLAGWRYKNFGQAGLAPTMANGAADNASFMNDGVPNLVKYGLGMDPTLNCYAAGGAGSALPMVGPQTVGGVPYLALTFTGAATDVTYRVLAASSLVGPWSTLATYGGAGAAGTAFTTTDTQPMSAGGARFMRLQVTNP